MNAREHWDGVYVARPASGLSWFEAQPATSLRLIERAGPVAGSSIVDVGAGASRLVDVLVEHGCNDVTVVDVSQRALDLVRDRLGDRAGRRVTFVHADVLAWEPVRTYDVWHDRALFHFLVAPGDQARYATSAARAVSPGGGLVLGTFAPDGPEQCSGLPVRRWAAEDLGRLFSGSFDLEHAERVEHVTPAGAVQPYTWTVWRRATMVGA